MVSGVHARWHLLQFWQQPHGSAGAAIWKFTVYLAVFHFSYFFFLWLWRKFLLQKIHNLSIKHLYMHCFIHLRISTLLTIPSSIDYISEKEHENTRRHSCVHIDFLTFFHHPLILHSCFDFCTIPLQIRGKSFCKRLFTSFSHKTHNDRAAGSDKHRNFTILHYKCSSLTVMMMINPFYRFAAAAAAPFKTITIITFAIACHIHFVKFTH